MLRGIPHIPTQQPPSRDPAGKGGLRLTPGETFRGTVVEAKTGGDVLILARGARFQASANRPLNEGQAYLFRVRASGERILLKVVDGEPPTRTSAIRLWASGQPARAEMGRTLHALAAKAGEKGLDERVRGLLTRLKNRMPALVYRTPPGSGAQWLSGQLRASGLFFESRAARLLLEGNDAPFRTLFATDLKGLLLSLKAALQEQGARDALAGTLAHQVDQALHVIQQDQMLNLTAWKEGLGWFWFLPGHPEDGFRGGELFARKAGSEDEGFLLSLSLDFTRLGHMDVAVSLNRSMVSLRILVDDPGTADFVGRHLEELRERIALTGLETGTIACRERRDDDPQGAPFLEEASLSGALDVVI